MERTETNIEHRCLLTIVCHSYTEARAMVMRKGVSTPLINLTTSWGFFSLQHFLNQCRQPKLAELGLVTHYF